MLWFKCYGLYCKPAKFGRLDIETFRGHVQGVALFEMNFFFGISYLLWYYHMVLHPAYSWRKHI